MNKLFRLGILTGFLLLPATFITAAETVEQAVTGFTQYQQLAPLAIQVPTVVEVPLDDVYIVRSQFGVLDTTRNIFQPYLYKNTMETNSIPTSIMTQPPVVSRLMTDNDIRTSTPFELPPGDTPGSVKITVDSSQPITSSRITLLLDNHVALPTSVHVATSQVGSPKITTLLATTKPNSNTITFPKTTATHWEVTLTYGQPLRIAEFKLEQLNNSIVENKYVRFLAIPNTTYEIYLNPDRQVDIRTGESGRLSNDKEVLRINSLPTITNPRFTEADVDEDGIPDARDNCTTVKNPDQTDINTNGRGDACDDFDRDGRINSDDNCINNPNSNQRDIDADGIGDACDEEESRITEKHKWIPWAGIGVAVVVIIILFAKTVHEMKKAKDEEPENSKEEPPQEPQQ